MFAHTHYSLKRTLSYYLQEILGELYPDPLPARKQSLYVNFVIHAEGINITGIFKQLLSFAKKFKEITGVKCVLCIPSPRCPMIKMQMTKDNVSDDSYRQRVLELLSYCDMGYHGHFFYEGRASGDNDALIPVSHENYDFCAIKKQILAEIAWFHEAHLVTKVYAAGWWFLKPEIVTLLEESGIEMDCSIRGRRCDFFGGYYLDPSNIPARGELFVLPPSKGIVEVQSAFYPVQHPYAIRGAYKEMASHLPGKPLYVVFPSHEGEIIFFKRELWKNIEALHRWDQFQWLSLEGYLKAAEAFRKNNVL